MRLPTLFSLLILFQVPTVLGEEDEGGQPGGHRLSESTSPYLRQHATNPVAWYPWGKEAFQAARERNVPIFLSVGYSTCHWCHVMERESFEDEEIATIMNENFVNIKVDREQRPDIDETYMTFVQATTGQGGWPMSVWLTPDLKPFFGGTYFPPGDADGRPGFPSIMRQISAAWQKDEKRIREDAGSLTKRLQELMSGDEASAELPPRNRQNGLLRIFHKPMMNNTADSGVRPNFRWPPIITFCITMPVRSARIRRRVAGHLR